MPNYHHHNWTYRPAQEECASKRIARKDAICAVLTLIVFAGWGVLLAWNG